MIGAHTPEKSTCATAGVAAAPHTSVTKKDIRTTWGMNVRQRILRVTPRSAYWSERDATCQFESPQIPQFAPTK